MSRSTSSVRILSSFSTLARASLDLCFHRKEAAAPLSVQERLGFTWRRV